jgi:probable rRNA maturation factor
MPVRHGVASRASGERPFLLLNRQRVHDVDRAQLTGFLERLTRELAPGREFSVVLIRDSVMREYNRVYRGKDAPTDVLSFEGDGGYLGDILISVETARRQADRSGTLTLPINLRRLALHGLLHLMGYDHEVDNGEMRALETRLRRRFGC